jgi:hypothetical protein
MPTTKVIAQNSRCQICLAARTSAICSEGERTGQTVKTAAFRAPRVDMRDKQQLPTSPARVKSGGIMSIALMLL